MEHFNLSIHPCFAYSPGITNFVKKEIKDSGYDFNLTKKLGALMKAGRPVHDQLTHIMVNSLSLLLDQELIRLPFALLSQLTRAGSNFILEKIRGRSKTVSTTSSKSSSLASANAVKTESKIHTPTNVAVASADAVEQPSKISSDAVAEGKINEI